MKQGPSSSSGGDQSNGDQVSSGTCEDDEENEDDDVDDEYDEIEDSKPQPLTAVTPGSASEMSPSGTWHHGNAAGEGRLPVESPRSGGQSVHMSLSHQVGYQQHTIQRRQHDDGCSSPSYNNRNALLDSVQTSAMQHCAAGWLPAAAAAAATPVTSGGHFQQHPFYGNEFATSGYGASPPMPHQTLFQPYSWYSASGPVQQSVAAQQTLLT